MKKYLLFLALFFFCLQGMAQDWQPSPGHQQIPLWPKGKMPNPNAIQGKETVRVIKNHLVAGKPWLDVSPVSSPTLTVYKPKKNTTGVGIVVFPGGGFWILAMDLEGSEVCRWVNSKGMTCILVKYRVPGLSPSGKGLTPRTGPYPNSPIALEDAQRAIGLVRYHAKQWGINPNKIGVMGFSAGGYLVAATSTLYKHRIYPLVDAADKVSCRPDFAVAVYPGHLWLNHKKFELNRSIPVTKNTPPTFITQAEDDPVDSVNNSLVYYIALKKAGVPVEMHLYAKGGHAFGLRPTNNPITHWPKLVWKWLHTIGVVSS